MTYCRFIGPFLPSKTLLCFYYILYNKCWSTVSGNVYTTRAGLDTQYQRSRSTHMQGQPSNMVVTSTNLDASAQPGFTQGFIVNSLHEFRNLLRDRQRVELNNIMLVENPCSKYHMHILASTEIYYCRHKGRLPRNILDITIRT